MKKILRNFQENTVFLKKCDIIENREEKEKDYGKSYYSTEF